MTQCRAQGIYPAGYYPHNIHFLATALVMEGRRVEALKTARKAASKHGDEVPENLLGFTHLLEALPSLVIVRFGMWEDILSSPAPAHGQPFVSAMHHFARGMAFSANGKEFAAKRELTLLDNLANGPVIKDQKVLDLNSLADIARIGVAMLSGDIGQRGGRLDDAVAEFGRAVRVDDGLLYSEPPEWFIPPRQYLAYAYMMRGNPAERVFSGGLEAPSGQWLVLARSGAGPAEAGETCGSGPHT